MYSTFSSNHAGTNLSSFSVNDGRQALAPNSLEKFLAFSA